MNQQTTTGIICLDDDIGLTYRICKIEYIIREDDNYSYIFTPNYSVIDLLTSDLFQGIPGLDLDQRKPEYIRNNITPVFISERTPGENREDLWHLLEKNGMQYLNRLEWLIRTDTRYGGDRFYVIRYPGSDRGQNITFQKIEDTEKRSVSTIKKLLVEICAGNNITDDGFSINDHTRKQYYSLLIALYKKEKHYLDSQRVKGIKNSAENGNYRGRTPIPIDETKLNEVINTYRRGMTTADEAAENLGVSKSTFFRKLRESK